MNKRISMGRTLLVFCLLLLSSLLFSCQSYQRPHSTSSSLEEVREPLASVQCKDPRSQSCTREYRPVCAVRDTGIRCVTTPCASTEYVTKSNACTACSDEKVSSYILGACK